MILRGRREVLLYTLFLLFSFASYSFSLSTFKSHPLPDELGWKAKVDAEQALLSKSGLIASEKDFEKSLKLVFNLMDANRDGKVSHQELYDFFRYYK